MHIELGDHDRLFKNAARGCVWHCKHENLWDVKLSCIIINLYNVNNAFRKASFNQILGRPSLIPTQHEPETKSIFPFSLFRNYSTVIALWLGCLFSVIKFAATSDPVFDPSTTMRLVLVPADAPVGAVIFRIRASDDEFDYPLTFELVGDISSSTVQIDSLPCTKYNSVCQANVVLRRRLEPGRYYDFQVSVKDTKGGMAQQSCSITATNFTTPLDLIFPKRTSIIMVSEVSAECLY